MERNRRYFLKDREAKALLAETSRRLKIDIAGILQSKAGLEIVETEFAEILIMNGRPLLAKVDQAVFPTLIFNEFISLAPKAFVDMGAVPYVCKGANIMAPGIRRFEGEFEKGDIVLVADENHGKALAVGEALCDLVEAKKAGRGAVIKSHHFVGDKIWNFVKSARNDAKRS